MDFDDAQGRKRQRTSAGGILPPPASSAGANGVSPNGAGSTAVDGTKQRLMRARSDSAPLGYSFGSSWAANRPRSGSGLVVRTSRREDMVVPSIGSVARAVAVGAPVLPPMGSLATATSGQ